MPVTSTEFATLMAACDPFETAPHIAVALSGGVDSTCLTWLLHKWCDAHNGKLTALTFDHGLRTDSKYEAEQIHENCLNFGITHHILSWDVPEKPQHNIQAAAREARRQALFQFCYTHHIWHLCFAHHQDDQLETFFLRLGRGSGVKGLSAMQQVSYTPNLRILRPLLSLPKSILQETIKVLPIPLTVFEDPSNQKPLYARNKTRKLLPQLANYGLETQHIHTSLQAIQTAHHYINQNFVDYFSSQLVFHPLGQYRLPLTQFQQAPQLLQIELLGRIIKALTNHDYTPRYQSMRRTLDLISKKQITTLGGVYIHYFKDQLSFIREWEQCENLPISLPLTQPVLWDNRFIIGAGSTDGTCQEPGTRNQEPGLDPCLRRDDKEGKSVSSLRRQGSSQKKILCEAPNSLVPSSYLLVPPSAQICALGKARWPDFKKFANIKGDIPAQLYWSLPVIVQNNQVLYSPFSESTVYFSFWEKNFFD